MAQERHRNRNGWTQPDTLNLMLKSMSLRRECQTEQYFSRERSIARWMWFPRYVTGDGEHEIDADETVRIVVRAVAAQLRLQAPQIVPALFQDVDDVHGHAGGKSETEGLHRGGTLDAGAVERERDSAGGALEHEVVVPDEFDDGRWLRGHGALRTLSHAVCDRCEVPRDSRLETASQASGSATSR